MTRNNTQTDANLTHYKAQTNHCLIAVDVYASSKEEARHDVADEAGVAPDTVQVWEA